MNIFVLDCFNIGKRSEELYFFSSNIFSVEPLSINMFYFFGVNACWVYFTKCPYFPHFRHVLVKIGQLTWNLSRFLNFLGYLDIYNNVIMLSSIFHFACLRQNQSLKSVS